MTDVLYLRDDVDAAFGFGFVMPRDYRDESPVKIVLALTAARQPCEIQFDPVNLYRVRNGAVRTGGVSGFSARKGGRVSVVGDTNTAAEAVFVVRPGEVMDGQRAGDSLYATVRRDGGSPDDTCGFVDVFGIDVTYRTRK